MLMSDRGEPRSRSCIDEARLNGRDGAAAEDRSYQWRAARWRKLASQWTNTLAMYANPVIGNKPVADVTTDDVLQILTPIWSTKTETASRVRSRIELVLSYAKAKGLRAGENPAQWRGHLDALLPKPSKVKRVRHRPALPWVQMAAFMEALLIRHDEVFTPRI